jgi:copper homeostasis protein
VSNYDTNCPTIEVCVESADAGLAAISAGADRLELNSHLELDGLTPSLADCASLVTGTQCPVIAMLRPHHRSFVYDQTTHLMIFRQAEKLIDLGVCGLAFGALLPDRSIDVRLMAHVRKLTEGKQLVMHRAFDCLTDQLQGLEQLIDLGIDRVLTSGGKSSAEQGIDQIRSLVQCSCGRIEILPGAGINATNAERILLETGCNQLHGTFRNRQVSTTSPDRDCIRQLKQLRLS